MTRKVYKQITSNFRIFEQGNYTHQASEFIIYSSLQICNHHITGKFDRLHFNHSLLSWWLYIFFRINSKNKEIYNSSFNLQFFNQTANNAMLNCKKGERERELNEILWERVQIAVAMNEDLDARKSTFIYLFSLVVNRKSINFDWNDHCW